MDPELEQVYDGWSYPCNWSCCCFVICPCWVNANITESISKKLVRNKPVAFEEFSYCYNNWWKDCIMSTLCDVVSYRMCCCSTCSIITRRRRFSMTDQDEIQKFKQEPLHTRCGNNLANCCSWPFWFRVALCPCCIVGSENKYIKEKLHDNPKGPVTVYTQVPQAPPVSIVPPGERFSVI